MNDTISRRSFFFMIVWAAGIVLFYFFFGFAGTHLLRRYRAETESTRAAWLASPTTDPRAPALDESAPADARPVEVRAGIEVNRIGEFALTQSAWTADFDIWFRWTGEALDPGESFDVVNGEILKRELQQSAVRGAERYERYRVAARMAKSFDPSRFPFGDEGLVIEIEDTEHGARELRYEADTGGVDISRLPRIQIVHIEKSLLLVKLHRYAAAHELPAGVGTGMNSRLIFAMLAAPPGMALYLKMFQALFASVAIALVVFFIRPIHVDPRFGLPVGAFFAAVGNNIYLASLLPQSNRITLTSMVNAIGLFTIFLAVVQSAVSLHMLDTMGRERLSRFFDRISFAVILIGYTAVNLMLPAAAHS